MKQETQVQKVLIVFLLSLALLAFISVASLQIRNNQKSFEKGVTYPTSEPLMDISYNEETAQISDPEEGSIPEVFENENVPSEEDFLFSEDDLMEEDAFMEQDMKDMEKDADFILAE